MIINIKKNQTLRNTFNKRSAKFILRKPQDTVEGNYKTTKEWKNLLCSQLRGLKVSRCQHSLNQSMVSKQFLSNSQLPFLHKFCKLALKFTGNCKAPVSVKQSGKTGIQKGRTSLHDF